MKIKSTKKIQFPKKIVKKQGAEEVSAPRQYYFRTLHVYINMSYAIEWFVILIFCNTIFTSDNNILNNDAKWLECTKNSFYKLSIIVQKMEEQQILNPKP